MLPVNTNIPPAIWPRAEVFNFSGSSVVERGPGDMFQAPWWQWTPDMGLWWCSRSVQSGGDPRKGPGHPGESPGTPQRLPEEVWEPIRDCSGIPCCQYCPQPGPEKQGETEEFTRNAGNLLVWVNHPANRHLRPLLPQKSVKRGRACSS